MRRAPETLGCERARWRLADLRQQLPFLAGYSLAGLSRALQRLGLRLRRGRLRLHSPDPAYADKLFRLQRFQRLARRFPERLRLVYVDEMSLYRQPSLAPVYTPVGSEPRATWACRTNDRQRYLGALDVVSGQLTWQHTSRITVPVVCKFLEQLRAASPERVLCLAWDNWSVHRHTQVLATAKRLKIELLWLPTYAPWTNPIEKLWRWLRQTVVHHHRLADQWAALQRQVAAFFDRFQDGSTELLHYVGLLPD